MASDDPSDHTSLADLIITPLKYRPLEELPPAVAEALEDYPDLREQTIAIRKDFLKLQERARKALSPLLDGVELGCPDLSAKLAEWNESLARAEVPADLGNLSLMQAKERYIEGLFYFRVLGLIRSDVESALSIGLPTAGLMPTHRDEEHLARLRAAGQEAEAKDYEAHLVSSSIQAASNLSHAFAHFLGAFRRVLNIFAGVRPGDLVRGGIAKRRPSIIGSAPKYARGIQAAVDYVYRPGMKERECWEALRAFINDAPTEDIDGEGWYEPEEVAEGRYKFKSDSTAGKESVAVKDIDTSQVRSIRRDSINPYWGRAKESGTASSSVS